jgi:thioredoxin 1
MLPFTAVCTSDINRPESVRCRGFRFLSENSYTVVRQKRTVVRGVLVLNDDELEEIRRRKMQLLMERAQQAQQPQVMEPMANGRVNLLTDNNFWSTIQQTKFAIVDFFGQWCRPCKTLAPIFAELAQDYDGKVYFAKIDIDLNRRTTTQFGVHSVPMVIAFKDGKPIGKIPGLRSYADYDNALEQMVGKGPDNSSYV